MRALQRWSEQEEHAEPRGRYEAEVLLNAIREGY